MTLTVGSLFSGYGGLDMAVDMALGPTRTVWVSDIEPGPVAILTKRFPDAPNLGDITAIDWATVEPVDIICGGSPCQDLSSAGQRAGMRPGTRSGLWESMVRAVDTLRPRLVIWENVYGALSAPAYSLMESETGHLGDGTSGPVLRAPGRVLGDLAAIGYDARWQVVRASDVGAPHQRARLFVVAYPHGDLLGEYTRRAPTQEAGTHEDHRPANTSGGSLGLKLLPTPTANRPDGRKSESFSKGRLSFYEIIKANSWEEFTPAMDHWAGVLGRPVPKPTQTSKSGTRLLSPAFVEWMMGLPWGWVTDIDISRAQQLRALGNGVVPQQGAAAITQLLERR